MNLTLNSTIGDLVLAIGKIIVESDVVHKEKIGDMYTITVQNYGVFVVTKTNYESLKIGDEVRF
nr:MAG TPA: Protein of unknown function (DUF1372) [Caudoviricetes sp.]